MMMMMIRFVRQTRDMSTSLSCRRMSGTLRSLRVGRIESSRRLNRRLCTNGHSSGGDVPTIRGRENVKILQKQTWKEVVCKETGETYWWSPETDETTDVGVVEPPLAWTKVEDTEGNIYYWCEEYDLTTAIGEPRPCIGEFRREDETNPSSFGMSSGGGSVGANVLAGAGIGLGFGIVGFFLSDRRVKDGIEFVNLSPSGIPIYRFKYLNDDTNATYEGTTAQDLLALRPNTVVRIGSGRLAVNYSALDLSFRKV